MLTSIRYMFVIFVFCVPGELRTLKKRETLFPNGCLQVSLEIGVGSFAAYTNSNNVLVRWEHSNIKNGDWIGVFQSNPKTGKVVLEPTDIIRVTDSLGEKFVSLNQEITKPENLGFTSKCLNYYAGYFDKCHYCLNVACLKTEPEWMWSLKKKIGPKKIKKIIIPGSHRSAWYSDNVKTIPYFKRFQSQDDSILGQLIYGTRYVHVSMGYFPNENNKWWISHPHKKLCPLSVILKDIRTFLESTKEIVILDFKDFSKEFDDPNVHIWFMEHLRIKIGDLAVPNSLTWDTTFDKVWRTKRRLIVAYNFKDAVVNSKFFWSTVPHKGYQGHDILSLQHSLSTIIKRPHPTVWAARAYISGGKFADSADILGAKKTADSVNSQISDWYGDAEWLDNSNIVLVDFIRNSGIIRAAVEWNSGECQ